MGAVPDKSALGAFTHRTIDAAGAPPVQTQAASSVFDLTDGAARRRTKANARREVAEEQAEPAAPGGRDFRCGLFSNGELVLELDGQSMRLPRESTRALVRYLDQVAGGALELS